jgi:hypothetical protein
MAAMQTREGREKHVKSARQLSGLRDCSPATSSKSAKGRITVWSIEQSSVAADGKCVPDCETKRVVGPMGVGGVDGFPTEAWHWRRMAVGVTAGYWRGMAGGITAW